MCPTGEEEKDNGLGNLDSEGEPKETPNSGTAFERKPAEGMPKLDSEGEPEAGDEGAEIPEENREDHPESPIRPSEDSNE